MYLYLPCYPAEDDGDSLSLVLFVDLRQGSLPEVAGEILTARALLSNAGLMGPNLWEIAFNFEGQHVTTTYEATPANRPLDWDTLDTHVVGSLPPEDPEIVYHCTVNLDQTHVCWVFRHDDSGILYRSHEVPYSFFEALLDGDPPTEVEDIQWATTR